VHFHFTEPYLSENCIYGFGIDFCTRVFKKIFMQIEIDIFRKACVSTFGEYFLGFYFFFDVFSLSAFDDYPLRLLLLSVLHR